MSDTPLLRAWFDILDGDDPDRVLERITDDFTLSIFFATADGSAEFHGDRDALVGYLAQREKSTLVHHILKGAKVDDTELVLGETRRAGRLRSLLQRQRAPEPEREPNREAADLPHPQGELQRLSRSVESNLHEFVDAQWGAQTVK